MSTKKNRAHWYLQLARGQTCTMQLSCCNHNPETTVSAHLHGFGGMGMKAPDGCTFWACSNCHDAYDGRRKMYYTQEELEEKAGLAQWKTMRKSLEMMSANQRKKLRELFN